MEDQMTTEVSLIFKTNLPTQFDAYWEISTDNILWTSYAIYTTNVNTYPIATGNNYFRIETTVDNGGTLDIVYSNVLLYEKL